jgi:hypothetical protein
MGKARKRKTLEKSKKRGWQDLETAIEIKLGWQAASKQEEMGFLCQQTKSSALERPWLSSG